MSSRTDDRLARGLGWFSIGLGLTEVLAPDYIARAIGVPRSRNLLRFFGMREIASGILIFRHPNTEQAVWSRVAGDVVDLAFLGAAYLSPSTDKERLAYTSAVVGAATGIDVFAGLRLRRKSRAAAVRMQSITIDRPQEEVYRFWRNLENLPRFMSHIESVRVTGENRSHWVARAPAGQRVEWDAEITEDRTNERIAWRSLKGADIDNSGFVEFRRAPGRRGTEVHAHIEYTPPAGILGVAIAKLFGEEPGQQLKGDLFRFKQVMETGEITQSDASIHKGIHPGKPPYQHPWRELPESRWTH